MESLSDDTSETKERRRVGLVYDERMCKHSTPKKEPHPENPGRIRAVWKKLMSAGIPQRFIFYYFCLVLPVTSYFFMGVVRRLFTVNHIAFPQTIHYFPAVVSPFFFSFFKQHDTNTNTNSNRSLKRTILEFDHRRTILHSGDERFQYRSLDIDERFFPSHC